MADQDHGRIAAIHRQNLLELLVALAVQAGVGFVEQDQGRIGVQCQGARNRNSLFDSAGQPVVGAVADDRLVARGQQRDDVVESQPFGLVQRFLGKVITAEHGEVLEDRAVE